jgi:hypothetical protein
MIVKQRTNEHVEEQIFIKEIKHRSLPSGEGEGGRGLK